MAKTTADVQWYGKEIGKSVAKRLRTNAKRVGMFIEGHVVRSISRGQPAERQDDGEMIGLDPSLPGEPPKVLTGLLRSTIYFRVNPGSSYVEVIVGANTGYARDLEFGNPRLNLHERPFLRPALAENRTKAVNMLVKGLFSKRKTWDRRKGK